MKREDPDQCAVCGMKIVDANADLCSNHSEAYRRLRDAYSLWIVAYDNLTTLGFLKQLVALPETGDRAREMAQFLIRRPQRWK